MRAVAVRTLRCETGTQTETRTETRTRTRTTLASKQAKVTLVCSLPLGIEGVADDMKSFPNSTLTGRPLSSDAQTVMAALRAQYTGRVNRTQTMDSFNGGLSQPQSNCFKTAELPTQTNMHYESSSSLRERAVRPPQSTLTENPDSCPKLQWTVLHKGKKGFLRHSELHSQLFQSGKNAFNQWGDNEASDGKLMDSGHDGSLLTLNAGDNITVPRNPEPCSRKGSASLGNQNAGLDVVAFPQEGKEKVQQPCPSEDASSAGRIPTVMRWSFGHLKIPTITCSKQVAEEDREQETRGGRSEPSHLFEERLEAVGGVMAVSTEEGDPGKAQFGAFLSEGLDEDASDTVLGRGNAQREHVRKGQYLSHQEDFTERTLSEGEFLNITVSADPCTPGETGNEKPYFSSRNRFQMPVSGMLDVSNMPSASLKASGFDHDTVVRRNASVDRINEKRETRLRERGTAFLTGLCVPRTDWTNVQLVSEESTTGKEHRTPPVVPRVNHNPQVQSQATTGSCETESLTKVVSPPKRPAKWEPPRPALGSSSSQSQGLWPKHTVSTLQFSSSSSSSEVQVCHHTQQSGSTRQPLNPVKCARSWEKRPVECAPPRREREKQEHSTQFHADIPTPSKQRRFASEVKDSQLNLDKNTEGDMTSATSKLTLALTSDPRICDVSRLSREEGTCMLEEAGRAGALVATMVYLDGTTQMDPVQKSTPAVCGFLVLLKKSLDSVSLEESGTAEERLLFLRLEHRPVWAQQDTQLNQDQFTREMLVQMACGVQSLVCYKAKDLLRTALTHFSGDLSWKQVSSCQVLDPQVASWLLDPADSASCFQDLLNKHCSHLAKHTPQSALKKVTHVVSSLSHLHSLMVELQNKLQTQGLWKLYFLMEMKMIPLLSAMESHKIYVDKKALKKTSEMLGTKMKQLEQEAHRAAGQQFLVSSSAQLRQVLFERLRLHERCEKNLPRTVLKQQSTSEAVLLLLQDLHPLPKLILEYRQAHKIKSTFVDGVLSRMTKTFISSTWNQTSAVTGRLSAKHPNFQALPKQPIKINKKQYVQGKEAELVTVHPRTMFIPEKGWTFLSADFCQVELRLLAHLSSDPELLRTFQNPEADVFTMLASQWKGVHEDAVCSEDREHAKRIVYSVIYGAGRERLAGILGLSAQQASQFQDSFLQTYRGVQDFIQRTVQHCHKHGYVKSIMGRRRSLPHIHSTDWGTRNQAERQAVNFVVQGSAADLCKMAMIQICSHVSSSTTLTARLVAQIHDELLFEVEDSQVEAFAVLVKTTMESLQYIDCLGVRLTVPLKVSVSTGRSWGSMCDVNLPHAAPHTSP
ncbi:DNA polymerase nu isoform X2 [Brachyhypopomus gauderio]|uniref:DNA polymerase nu isoform X2 n=1 Tax=Brachyhypopomus gauderio TaxID=698409 RepID=UPI0040424ABA